MEECAPPSFSSLLIILYPFQINYDEYIEVRSKMRPKIQAYFSPSLFLKLEKDEFGRISILTFFQFCVRKGLRSRAVLVCMIILE